MTYGYNANGWLTNISDWGTNTIVSYEYDAAGRRTRRDLRNHTFTLYEYDPANQITNIWHRRWSGGTTNTISSYAYGYYDGGQRKWVKWSYGKGDYYRYDAANQLTNVWYEATNVDTTPVEYTNSVSYRLDAAGNRTNVTAVAGLTTTSVDYQANHLNQYTNVGGVEPGYDDNGNLRYDGSVWTYSYDRENRLADGEKDGGNTWVSYVYDAFNRLIERRTSAGTATRFYYDHQWRVLAEYNETNGLVAKYVYGPGPDEPLRMTQGGSEYYYHAAALGTVTEVTSADGVMMERYRYDVYGVPEIRDHNGNLLSSSGIGNRLLFQGRDRDPDTGLYNFRLRYYSPGLGRFVQVDPIRQQSGLNMYNFVGNDPVCMIDPAGLFTFGEWGQIIGAGVGGFAEASFNVMQMSQNAQNTLVGMGLGLTGLAFGGDRPTFGNNAIQFPNNPIVNYFPVNTLAITLGNTISYAPGHSPTDVVDTYDNRNIHLGDHENAHIPVEALFGSLFIPAYLLAELLPGDNPFEILADDMSPTVNCDGL